MKKIAALVLCITACCCALAQSAKADSLRNILATTGEDTTRVMLYYFIGEEFLPEQPDSAYECALNGMMLSRKLKYRRGEMIGLGAAGNMLVLIGNFPGALAAQFQALTIAEELRNVNAIAEIYGNISRVYFFQKDYQQAIIYLDKLRGMGEKLGDRTLVGEAFENKGAVFIMTKQYDSALVYTQQAYSIAVEQKQPLYNLQLNMGHIYYGRGQLTLAMEYFRSALPEIDSTNNDYYKSEACLGMAKVFAETGKKDSCLQYARNSFVIANNVEFIQGSLDAAEYLTNLYRDAGNSDSAFYYSEHARVANDSLFSQQKMNQLQSITFAEQLRQKEKLEQDLQAREERKHNLQYAAIAVGIIVFIILFLLLSRTIIVNQTVIRFLAALSLLILFEFINLLIHPFIAGLTHHSPIGILAFMVCVAAMLIPIHHRLEHWMAHRLVEKNNKIRLEAARRTIAELGGGQTA